MNGEDAVWFGIAVLCPLVGFALGVLFGWAVGDDSSQ